MSGHTDGIPRPNDLTRLFDRRYALIGMIHLLPLPGAPRFDPAVGMRGVVDRAVDEARLLVDAGFDGLIVENGWDIPFLKPGDLGPETAAAMAVATAELARSVDAPIGVNCLANAVDTSIAIAAAAGGSFVRANQWANAYIANEGFIEGRAGVVTRYRHAIGADQVTVWADVQVKLGSHAITSDRSLTEQARDTAWFDADALIVTGSRLGDPPTAEDARTLRAATKLPLVAGSGVCIENLPQLVTITDGAIVGSAIKCGGVWHGDLDKDVCIKMCHERDRLEGTAP